MTNVRIADLKSRLSAHLRKVRAGRAITVLDRDTPIAQIVPYAEHGRPAEYTFTATGSAETPAGFPAAASSPA